MGKAPTLFNSFAASLALLTTIATNQAVAATVISFTGAPSGSITSYSEAGFSVSPIGGAWFMGNYGAPGPSLQFQQASQASTEITGNGQTFAFDSVDLYSSITEIPYTIVGFMGSATVFSMTGTVPHTFGSFVTVLSTSTLPVDKLSITLSNAFPGANPVGLDNVSLSPVSEPHVSYLFLLGAVLIAFRRKSE